MTIFQYNLKFSCPVWSLDAWAIFGALSEKKCNYVWKPCLAHISTGACLLTGGFLTLDPGRGHALISLQPTVYISLT